MPWPNLEFLYTLLQKYLTSKQRQFDYNNYSSSMNHNKNNSPSSNPIPGSPNLHKTSSNNNGSSASKRLSFEMDRDKDRIHIIEMCEYAFPSILMQDIPELYRRIDDICNEED